MLLRRVCPVFSDMDLTTEIQACMPSRIFVFIGIMFRNEFLYASWIFIQQRLAWCHI